MTAKYLTDNEKYIFGYIENVPLENEPLYEQWTEEEIEIANGETWDDDYISELETICNL